MSGTAGDDEAVAGEYACMSLAQPERRERRTIACKKHKVPTASLGMIVRHGLARNFT